MANEVQTMLDHYDLHATPKGVQYLQELYDGMKGEIRVGDRLAYDNMQTDVPLTDKMRRILSWACYKDEEILRICHDEDWRYDLMMFNAITNALDV